MKVIGITGGVGTGKSTVLNIINEMPNSYIIETDKLAHSLMEPDKPIYTKIVEEFGREILKENRYINRESLGKIVFNNNCQLLRLNNIVHPMVKEFILKLINEKNQENQCKYFIVEAALLIEDGYKNICDELWFIYSNKENRINRLINSRGYTREKCIEIINTQLSDEEFKKNCNYIIDNDNDLNFTKQQIFEILK